MLQYCFNFNYTLFTDPFNKDMIQRGFIQLKAYRIIYNKTIITI